MRSAALYEVRYPKMWLMQLHLRSIVVDEPPNLVDPHLQTTRHFDFPSTGPRSSVNALALRWMRGPCLGFVGSRAALSNFGASGGKLVLPSSSAG